MCANKPAHAPEPYLTTGLYYVSFLWTFDARFRRVQTEQSHRSASSWLFAELFFSTSTSTPTFQLQLPLYLRLFDVRRDDDPVLVERHQRKSCVWIQAAAAAFPARPACATCLFGGPWAMVLVQTTWYLSFGGVPRGSDPAPSTQLWSTDSHSASTSEMQGST